MSKALAGVPVGASRATASLMWMAQRMMAAPVEDPDLDGPVITGPSRSHQHTPFDLSCLIQITAEPSLSHIDPLRLSQNVDPLSEPIKQTFAKDLGWSTVLDDQCREEPVP
jgi:hypothetical protein